MIQAIALFISVFSLEIAAQNHLAVSDLEAKGITNDEAAVISDRLRSEIQSTGRFRLMERGLMSTILQEQGFQQSGSCNGTSCQIEMGKLLGVDRLLVGSVGKLGKTYTLSIRLISVETGEILQSIDEDIRGEVDELIRGPVKNIAQRLGVKPQANLSTPIEAPPKSNKKLWLRIGLGTLVALGAGGTWYFNTAIQDNNTELTDLREKYSLLNSSTPIETWQAYHDQDAELVDSNQSLETKRLVSAIFTSLAALGLGVTFAF